MFGVGLGLSDLPIRRSGPTYAEYALALDLKQGRYRIGNQFTPDPTALSGYSYARSGAKSELAASTGLVSFAANVPGILPGVGYWSRASLTNLFLNSAAGVTQSITVTAQAYTLSFFGTGTITLSGVSTAGPLVGAGASNRVSLTFTPTAGSLTLTVSGSCTNVVLVAGAQAGPVIVTAGAAATIGADALRVDGFIPTDEDQVIIAVVNIDAGAIAAQIGFIAISDGTNTNRIILYKAAAGNLDVRATLGSVEQTVTKPAVSGNISGRIAVLLRRSGGAWSLGYKKADGTTLMAAAGAAGAFPTGLNRFDIGNRIGVEPANSPVEFVGIRRGTFSDAECLAMLAGA